MLPAIPVPVFEQIAVVIIFAFLLGGMGGLLIRLFTRSIAEVNAHYANLIKESNQQWQNYFDARAESSSLLNQQVLERLQVLATVLERLSASFHLHDLLERQLLDQLFKASGRGSTGGT